jgi:putative phosphoribosyl transferase
MVTMKPNDSREPTPRLVEIPADGHRLEGILDVPPRAQGVVAFAHGSGSGRFSQRNQFVAQCLQQGGVGTLLLDLLEEPEAQDRRNVFDVALLAARVLAALAWLEQEPATRLMPLGLFGASTGAAAALMAAAKRPDAVAAVVARGGRPDLAQSVLHLVRAPTLLIVGGNDAGVLELNQEAHARLTCTKDFVVVPDATHLFPEPGALEAVASLARDWFLRHLKRRAFP